MIFKESRGFSIWSCNIWTALETEFSVQSPMNGCCSFPSKKWQKLACTQAIIFFFPNATKREVTRHVRRILPGQSSFWEWEYSLVLNTSHGVFPENCDQANFCMDITLLIPNRSWWDYKGHFQISLERVTINIIMIDKEMTELWHLKVCRVSYSSVSCIRDQRVNKLFHKYLKLIFIYY